MEQETNTTDAALEAGQTYPQDGKGWLRSIPDKASAGQNRAQWACQSGQDLPKFTPGPWEITTQGDGRSHLVQCGEDQIYIGVFGQGWRTDEALANARLIAIAPLLYEELLRALPTIDDCAEDEADERVRNAFRNQANRIRGILAKGR